MKMTNNLLFLFTFIPFSYADPFYGEQDHAKKISETMENNPEILKNPPPCNPTNSLNHPNFELEKSKLKLVGILKNGDQFKALYLTENQQLIDFKIDDLIGTQQIKSITLKTVEWIDWQKTENCQQPFTIIEKF